MADIPVVGEPYRLKRCTVIVDIDCVDCGVELHLVDAQQTICPTCGTAYWCGGLDWDVTRPGPPLAALNYRTLSRLVEQ